MLDNLQLLLARLTLALMTVSITLAAKIPEATYVVLPSENSTTSGF